MMAVDLTRAGTRCPRCSTHAAVPRRPRDELAWDDRAPGVNHQMALALEAAIPLWLDVLAAMDEDERDRHIWWWAKTAIDPICTRGDNLMYGRSKTKAERAQVAQDFNYLASALAALAYSPGGVTFAGRHWCTTPPEVTDAR
jgi:hypothetical protein